MRNCFHKLQHLFGMYKGYVVSKTVDDDKIMIGFQCCYCGETEWHDATREINNLIKKVLTNKKQGATEIAPAPKDRNQRGS